MGLFRNLLDQISRTFEQGNTGRSNNSASSHGSPPGPTCSSSRNMNNESSIVCHNPEHISSWSLHELNLYRHLCSGKTCSWIVPLAGNAFLTGNGPTPDANCITGSGLVNWNTADIAPALFFHCDKPGAYLVGLRVYVPPGNTSKISVSLMNCTSQSQCQAPQNNNEVTIEGISQGAYQIINCGQFHIGQEGYVKIALVGIQKSGHVYADVSHAILIPEEEDHSSGSRQKRSLSVSTESPPEKSQVKFVSDPQDFYFGRRGPSVHLFYEIPLSTNPEGLSSQVEYFYNEILVPPNQDVIGSYFCAIGFSGGYFGIQVNSSSERRVLFSIWSAYTTDNPDQIPQDYKVVPIQKGSSDVHVGEFGNEGSGGQSYLRYTWKANTVYKFLVQGKPLDENNTMFSAWISDSSEPGNVWRLIASFKKPKVSTFLHGIYSFSENFIPEMGHVERQCLFGNQWAWDSLQNDWVEVTKARFTADETARRENRKDVAGGVVQSYGWNDGSTSRFFLRNCGFFSDIVQPGLEFCRSACACKPSVDFSNLPRTIIS